MRHNLSTLLCALEIIRCRRVTPRDLFDAASRLGSDPSIAYVSWTNRNGIESVGQRWTWGESNYYITLENYFTNSQVIATIEYGDEVTEE